VEEIIGVVPPGEAIRVHEVDGIVPYVGVGVDAARETEGAVAGTVRRGDGSIRAVQVLPQPVQLPRLDLVGDATGKVRPIRNRAVRRVPPAARDGNRIIVPALTPLTRPRSSYQSAEVSTSGLVPIGIRRGQPYVAGRNSTPSSR
jgi:hypothetical protein